MKLQFLRPALAGLAGALALCAASGVAAAETKKELVARVVQLQQGAVENIARSLSTQTAQQVLQTAGQAMVNVAPEKREAVAKDVQAEVKKFYDEIDPILRDRAGKLAPTVLGPLLEEKLTEDELKQIITWLESPASKKYQQMGNELQSALTQKLVADTRPAVEPKLKTLEAALQKKLGTGPASAPAAAPAPAPAKPAPKK
jgi:uncharacterized protein